MSEELSKKNLNNIGPLEENSLDWKSVLKELKTTFGNDVYESWIKNINLIKEFNHYVILSAPTRFCFLSWKNAKRRNSFLKNRNRIINAIIKYIIPLPINPSINCNVDNPIQAKQRNNLMYL